MDAAVRLTLRHSVREIVEPTIERLGFELVAVELGTSHQGVVLRLTLDGPAGVGIGDCARVSRAVSPELDVEDPIPSGYTLEVSSPGIDRPVERPADFERFKGFRAKVKMLPGHGRKRYSGVLAGFDDGHVLLNAGDQQCRLLHAEVDRVRLDLDLDEFERLGNQRSAAAGGTP